MPEPPPAQHAADKNKSKGEKEEPGQVKRRPIEEVGSLMVMVSACRGGPLGA